MKKAAGGVAWLPAEMAAVHVGIVDAKGKPRMKAFYEWVRTERARTPRRLTVHWLGERMRFRAADLDACMEPEPETKAAPERVPFHSIAGGRR